MQVIVYNLWITFARARAYGSRDGEHQLLSAETPLTEGGGTPFFHKHA